MKIEKSITSFGRIKPKTCMIIGTVALGAAAIFAVRTVLFLTDSKFTDGKIVDVEERISSSRSNSYVYFPTIEFTADDGKPYSFQSSYGESVNRRPTYETGQIISVVYDALDPSRAHINNFWSLWIGPIIFLFIGSIFIFIAYAFNKSPRKDMFVFGENEHPLMSEAFNALKHKLNK